jgi:signal transduction histidine kinase
VSDRPARRGSSRAPVPLDEKQPLFRVLVRRSLWFVRLRWMVPPAMAMAVGVGRLLELEFEAAGVLWVALAILVYNVALWAVRSRIARGHRASVERFTWAQVSLDYLAMFALIELTGGISSPVSVFFLFHIILAAMLLRPLSAWMCATVAVVGLVSITAHDAVSGVQHAVRFRGVALAVSAEPRLIAVALALFAAAAFITTFLSTTVLRELRLTTLDLFESRGAVERASAERDKFMLQVTHNLKAPAAACVSFAQVLGDDYLGPLNDKQRDYLGRLERRLRGLLDTITELLAVARHRNAVRTMRRAPVDMGALAARIHQVFSERARQKGVELRLESLPAGEPLLVLGDEQLLEQVLENLVSNAVKYTPKGHVTLRLLRDEERIGIDVEDTGIGIPAAALPRLFTEFFRAKNARALDPGGTGLGLTTARETIEQHGGTLDVASEEGVGSRFSLKLPAHKPDSR